MVIKANVLLQIQNCRKILKLTTYDLNSISSQGPKQLRGEKFREAVTSWVAMGAELILKVQDIKDIGVFVGRMCHGHLPCKTIKI